MVRPYWAQAVHAPGLIEHILGSDFSGHIEHRCRPQCNTTSIRPIIAYRDSSKITCKNCLRKKV